MGILDDGLKEDDLSMGLNDTSAGIMVAPSRTDTSLWKEYCRVQGCGCRGHMQPGHPTLQTQDITSDIVPQTIENGAIVSLSRPRGFSQVFVDSADIDPSTKKVKPTESRRIPLGHIPIASLLGEELDPNFMLPEPTPGPSQSALSPSAAASTLPTPPSSTASPREGTFTRSPQLNGDPQAPSFAGEPHGLSSTIDDPKFEHSDDMYKEPTPAPDYMDIYPGDHAPPVSDNPSHLPQPASLSSPPTVLEPSRGHQGIEPSVAPPLPLRTVPPPREPTPAHDSMDVDQTGAASTSPLAPSTSLMQPSSILSRRLNKAGGQGEGGPSKLLRSVQAVPYRQPSPSPMEVDLTYNTHIPPNHMPTSRPPGAGAEPYTTTAASSLPGGMNYYAWNTQSHDTASSAAQDTYPNCRPTQSQPHQLSSTPGASTSTAHLRSSSSSQLDSAEHPPFPGNQRPLNRNVPTPSIPSIIDGTQQGSRTSVPPPRDHPTQPPRPQLTDLPTSSSSSYPLPSPPLYHSTSSQVQQSPPKLSSKVQQPSITAQLSTTRVNTRPERAALPELVLTTPEVERQQGEPAPPASPSKSRSPKGKGRLIKEDSKPEPDHQFASTSSTTRIVKLPDHEEGESQPTSPVSPVDIGSSSKPLKGIRKFACNITGCGKTFTRKNDVVRHMKSAAAHRDFLKEDPNSVARCGKCNRILSRYDSAKRHEGSSSCGKRVLPSELKTKVAKPKKNRKRGKPRAGEPGEDGGESKDD